MMKRERLMDNPLQLKSLNHISVVCRSLQNSLHFYQDLLGFSPIRRPGSFDFDGAWLFNYGMGVHLLQSEHPENMPKITHINPKDNHISFQCESIGAVEKKLKEMKIEYVKGRVEEGGIYVEQVFFHDPDGSMIEICNCDVLPVIPISIPIPIPIPAADHNHNNNNGVSTIRPCSLLNCNLNPNSTISC